MVVNDALNAAQKVDELDVQVRVLPKRLNRNDWPKLNTIIFRFLELVAKWNIVTKDDWFVYAGCTLDRKGWQCNTLDQSKYIQILTAYNKLYQFQARLKTIANGMPVRTDLEKERLINYPHILNYKKVA